VIYGHGNLPEGAGGEGIIYQRTVATYLHGPVLARNPWLADRLLAWVLERRGWGVLEPLDDRLERLAAERWRRARP
jgi:CobQ-like glutamine amidotransferase family enzyme